jgi:hypothetical protein
MSSANATGREGCQSYQHDSQILKVPVKIKSMKRINYPFSRKCKLIKEENDEVISNEWRKLFQKTRV